MDFTRFNFLWLTDRKGKKEPKTPQKREASALTPISPIWRLDYLGSRMETKKPKKEISVLETGVVGCLEIKTSVLGPGFP